MSLRGATFRALDSAGRIGVPPAWRAELAQGGAILGGTTNGMAALWPSRNYERYTDTQCAAVPTVSPRFAELERYFYGSSYELELDAEGCIALPVNGLLSFRLESKNPEEVFLAGAGDRIYILDSEKQWIELTKNLSSFNAMEVRLTAVSDALLHALREEPELWRKLDPRQFEELMAELYARQGFDVELTARGPDGGVDLYVIHHTAFGRLVTVVDCKRYRAGRAVGIVPVQRMHSTVEARGFAKGVLATTAHFSTVAVTFAKQYPLRLCLQDFIDLQSLLSSTDVRYPFAA